MHRIQQHFIFKWLFFNLPVADDAKCLVLHEKLSKNRPRMFFSWFSLGKRSFQLEAEFLGQIWFPNDGLSDFITILYEEIIRTALSKLKGQQQQSTQTLFHLPSCEKY